MDAKGKVLLQFFNKSKLRNGTKRFLESNFSQFIVKFKKLGFSAPLSWANNMFCFCLHCIDWNCYSYFWTRKCISFLFRLLSICNIILWSRSKTIGTCLQNCIALRFIFLMFNKFVFCLQSQGFKAGKLTTGREKQYQSGGFRDGFITAGRIFARNKLRISSLCLSGSDTGAFDCEYLAIFEGMCFWSLRVWVECSHFCRHSLKLNCLMMRETQF